MDCELIPKVKDPKGNDVDSKLFTDLVEYFGDRNKAVHIYLVTKGDPFIRDFKDSLSYDSNGEPTLKSVRQMIDIDKLVSSNQQLEYLNRKWGASDNKGPILYPSRDQAYNKASKFNQESPLKEDYVAIIDRILKDKTEYYSFGIVPRDRQNNQRAAEMDYNQSLGRKIRELLATKGISVDTLTDLEKRMGVQGVTDFSVSRNTADGFIRMIRLAKGVEGENALPEEFSHFIIEASTDPLVGRLVNLIADRGLEESILGEEYSSYRDAYKGNKERLAKEAAGKVLAEALKENYEYTDIPKSFLQRVVEAVKNWIRTMFSTSEFARAKTEAMQMASDISARILDSGLGGTVDLSNISSTDKYYSIKKETDRVEKTLRDIIDREQKRYVIYSKRDTGSKFSRAQERYLDELEMKLSTHDALSGIASFCNNTLDILRQLDTRLKGITDMDSTTAEKARVLRDIRNYMYSYMPVLREVKAVLRHEGLQDELSGTVKKVVDESLSLLDDLHSDYNSVTRPLFLDFIRPFLKSNMVVPFGKNKGETITAEKLLDRAENDISFFDRWLDSMADSSDIMLKLFDQAVKRSRERAKTETLDILKELQAAGLELERSGVKGTDWMYEKDDQGIPTGLFISEINMYAFRTALSKMYRAIEDKYGKNPQGEDAQKARREMGIWFRENTEIVDGKRMPSRDKYGSAQFRGLNEAQKKFYNIIIGIKESLDNKLPDKATVTLRAPQIRKDFVERAVGTRSIKGALKEIQESIKDSFLERVDDDAFGDKSTIIDFEGNVVHTLPVYYTKPLENRANLSTDVVSTMAAYAAMATEYEQMGKIVDVLEVGRDLMNERDVIQTQGKRQLKEKIKLGGRVLESELKVKRSNIQQKLDDFIETQVYGIKLKDEGTLAGTKVSTAKAANALNSLTAMSTLAFNALAGASNVLTGVFQTKIESAAGEYFNRKNMRKADKKYFRELIPFLGEIGNRVKTSKLALFDEKFEVMQEFDRDIKEVNFDRKTWFSRMFSHNAMFFINNVGEHWLQNRVVLALADNYKMKTPSGKIVSLWDSLEVVPIIRNGRKAGARLELKEGYTKENGEPFTEDDLFRFKRKAAQLNHRIHGIYNNEDRNAWKRTAIGRMGMMFRNWIKSSLNRRFKGATYDMDLDAWTEGYYMTMGRFIGQLARDLRDTQFQLGARFNELTNHEKANIRRAITESVNFIVIAMAAHFIEWPEGKNRPWLLKMLQYQTERLKTELGVLAPVSLPSMINEGMKILKSPAAPINTIQNLLNCVNLLNPMDWSDELQSGRYKGHSTNFRNLMNAIPVNNTIWRTIYPEDSIPFFRQ